MGLCDMRGSVDFICKDCGRVFKVKRWIVSISEKENIYCPKCRSVNVEPKRGDKNGGKKNSRILH